MSLLSLDRRWLALIILCLGDLMIVLDTTIVNVALPSIKAALGFGDTSLVWVVNAYMLTFSGFLLLGGRLGDLYGHKKLFLIGLSIFTVASLACGVAGSQMVLITARAVQGFGGALVSAIALSLIMNLFSTDADRAKAMGVFGFVSAGGGAIGVFLGGLLTGAFDWHWVFLVNIPIGALVILLCIYILPQFEHQGGKVKLDIGGAVTITASLILAVYAIVNGNIVGWLSFQTLGLAGLTALLFAAFVLIERSVESPLVPFDIFARQNVLPASIIGILWSAAMFAWFFLSALYMQLVLGFSPILIGMAFLPANVIMAVFSLGLSAKIVMRFGTRLPLALGMSFVGLGLVLFALAPADGTFWFSIVPGMVLAGIGAGLAFNPVLLAATSDVPESESGLASGVLNTAFMMGGSLGLAVLASLAAVRTSALLASGASMNAALLGGYHLAFIIGAVSAFFAAALAFTAIREGKRQSAVHVH